MTFISTTQVEIITLHLHFVLQFSIRSHMWINRLKIKME